MESSVQKFHRKFNALYIKGLSAMTVNGNRMINLEDYYHKLYSIYQDK